MLSQGISPNTIVNGGDPALVRAIRMDSYTVVDALLSAKGIEVDTASEYGETALMLPHSRAIWNSYSGSLPKAHR